VLAPLVVGFHGYAQHAQAMLDDLERVPGAAGWTLVSIQALHRFYNTRTGEVVASWMTKEDRELAIADNVAYAGAVVREVAREHPYSRLAYVGFSQGVATAFRAAARAGIGAHAVVALGGDIPPELRDGCDVALPPVLIGRGNRDEYYTAAKLAVDAGWLTAQGIEHATLTFEGGHEWTEAFRQAAGDFLARTLR
jgi:predicted esterase